MPRIDLEGLPDKEPVETAVVAAPSGIDFEALPDKEVSKKLTSPERLPRWKDIKDKIPANMKDYEQDAKDAISVAATYDLDMDQAYSIQGKLKEELDQPNLWDQAQGSFKAGMGDVYVGMGNTLKWAGMNEEFSDVYVDFGERMRDAYIPAADQSEFSWRKTIDPEWWATTVTRSVPFTLSLIPAAVVGAYGGAAGAGAAGLGTFGTTVVTALGGAAASRPLESAFEAAAAYETALARGDSEEDASSAADKVFASNMLLVGMDAAQFAVAFTPLKFGKGMKPSLLRRMSAGTGKLSAVAISEAGEERYQEYIQMEALGEEANFFDIDNPRLNEASTIGGIFGAGMGGVGSVWNALTKKTTEAMPEDLKTLYNDVRAQSLSGGADEAQAARDALDAVAGTPEGKEHIETVLNDMKETASKEMPVEGKPEISAPTIEELFEKLKTEDLTEEELGGLLDQFAGGREIIEEVQSEPVAEIKERLLATGMDEAEATANAALFDGFRVLAQRAGVSVDDLMERYLPEVSREGVEEVAAQVVTEEERRAITDNPFLSDQITTEEQLGDAESLRAARERINETLVEQKEEQTVSDEEMLQLGEAVDFLDSKIKAGVAPVERPEVPLTQPTQEGIAPDGPRARVSFTPEGVSIDLFKKADESSFVHETGHLYFRMMADLSTLPSASEELKTDFETLKTWLNYEEGQVGFSVDQQEQFARGFEAYLREGKAPSSALAAAFENFKQWLMQIYKSLRELNVELTDEVRGVMDRMLADEGIEVGPAEGVLEQAPLEEEAFEQATTGQPKPKEVKPLVRKVTGQVKDPELIALRKEFTEAARIARAAYKAGKDYSAVKEARKLKNILARTRKIRLVRDYFNLTDADLKKISRKNPLLLSQYEFKLYIDDVRIKAAQLSEHQLQKALLINMIYEKDLAKVDNYRRVLGLPPISQMTTDQVKEFARALEPFHDGDVFLSERELETVDRTDLEGIKTWREAKERLAAEIGVSIEELETIKVTEWDEYKWDTALAEANPFYKMLVTETTRKLLEADLRFHEIENELFDLARKSEKSRNRTFVERAIPQDKQIMTYLETPSEDRGPVAEAMTPEQIDLANYMEQYFQIALEYLVKTKSLDRGRQNYFVHMRRSFLENVKEAGLVQAFKDMFKSYQEDEAVFNIMDEDTGNILPLEKFFQFSMQRTGGIDPTTNVTKAFLVYAQMMEKKISLDELIPKMDIYAQSITPAIYTPRGLEVDRSIKKFVNKYINNRKARRIRWISKQGGTIDVATRGARSLTTLIDLGFNIPSGVAAFVGEQATNFGMLGISGYTKGNARIKTKKGKAILKKYEAFIGRSSWENFTAPGKELTERIYDGLFGLFHEASVLANKQFLLGAITDDEYNKGELTSERLAILKVEMGRLRVVPGTKSMVGSTSAGSAMMQYKTWAAPIISTLTRDIKTLVNDLAKKPTGEALTTKEAREIYRVIGLTTTALIVGAMASAEDDDETFTGQVLKRVYRESMTLIQGVDPSLWLATPRLMGFMTQLGKNLKAIATLEEYKTKPGLVGVEGLQKQLTPRAFKQFDEPKKKERL